MFDYNFVYILIALAVSYISGVVTGINVGFERAEETKAMEEEFKPWK